MDGAEDAEANAELMDDDMAGRAEETDWPAAAGADWLGVGEGVRDTVD